MSLAVCFRGTFAPSGPRVVIAIMFSGNAKGKCIHTRVLVLLFDSQSALSYLAIQ